MYSWTYFNFLDVFFKERASEKNESLTHLTGKVNYKAQNNHKKSAIIKTKKSFTQFFEKRSVKQKIRFNTKNEILKASKEKKLQFNFYFLQITSVLSYKWV